MAIIEKTTIDSATGEVLNATTEVAHKRKGDSFMQVYLEDMQSLLGISTTSEFKIMLYIWKYSVYKEDINGYGNEVKVDKRLKDVIYKECGYKDGTVRNVVAKFVSNQLLIPDDKYNGIYYLNPQYFFKGEYKNRLPLVKAVHKYYSELDGKKQKVTVKIDYSKEEKAEVVYE